MRSCYRSSQQSGKIRVVDSVCQNPRLSAGQAVTAPRSRRQARTVLVQDGHGEGHPAAVPAVSHSRRRFRGARDAFRGQQGIIGASSGLVVSVSIDPDPVLVQERRLAGIDEGGRRAVIGLEVGVGAVRIAQASATGAAGVRRRNFSPVTTVASMVERRTFRQASPRTP